MHCAFHLSNCKYLVEVSTDLYCHSQCYTMQDLSILWAFLLFSAILHWKLILCCNGIHEIWLQSSLYYIHPDYVRNQRWVCLYAYCSGYVVYYIFLSPCGFCKSRASTYWQRAWNFGKDLLLLMHNAELNLTYPFSLFRVFLTFSQSKNHHFLDLIKKSA